MRGAVWLRLSLFALLISPLGGCTMAEDFAQSVADFVFSPTTDTAPPPAGAVGSLPAKGDDAGADLANADGGPITPDPLVAEVPPPAVEQPKAEADNQAAVPALSSTMAEPDAASKEASLPGDALTLRPAILDAGKNRRQRTQQAAFRSGAGDERGELVQIGSYRSEVEANMAWDRLQAASKGLLEGRAATTLAVDLPSKGRWYRLRAEVPDGEAAVAFCTQLKARGLDCLPVRE